MGKVILIVLIFLMIGCKSDISKNQSIQYDSSGFPEKVFTPFDTAFIISKLNIEDNKSRYDLVEMDTLIPLLKQMDTLVMFDHQFACDCPSWENTASFNHVAENQHANDSNLYYIELASPDLELPWRIMKGKNKIQFIGREYKEKGYPANPKFISPDPPKGKVFRYYSYKIIKPYNVWGPKSFTDIDEKGDSLFTWTELIVK